MRYIWNVPNRLNPLDIVTLLWHKTGTLENCESLRAALPNGPGTLVLRPVRVFGRERVGLTISAGNQRRRQMQRVKASGWTSQKRQTFLDTLAVTCNVNIACAEAAMSRSSVYHLRRRDPEFAELWRQALLMGYDRLEERLLRRAGAGVNDVEFGGGDRPEDPLDPELALNLLRAHRPTVEGKRKRLGGEIHRISREEAKAALAKRLDALEKRLKAEQGK